ncbi:hypothetical protein [Aquimarina megaterium]|uniref:hypothetical protein n=1 Tax=Aquimarina megaterium TaxID=1443666 RepID=UPI000945A834|nr:hypothetical protein [Aquimarina megaterium]
MATIREKFVKKGKWKTMESFFNANGVAFFKAPNDASIKVRYGVGWFGKDRQKQKLDGRTYKKLQVGKWSLTRARMQIKVKKDTNVTYYVDGRGVAQNSPEIRF